MTTNNTYNEGWNITEYVYSKRSKPEINLIEQVKKVFTAKASLDDNVQSFKDAIDLSKFPRSYMAVHVVGKLKNNPFYQHRSITISWEDRTLIFFREPMPQTTK